MTHALTCPGADVHEVRGVTFSLWTCRSCHAEQRVTR
jgi:hypothetical protein